MCLCVCVCTCAFLFVCTCIQCMCACAYLCVFVLLTALIGHHIHAHIQTRAWIVFFLHVFHSH